MDVTSPWECQGTTQAPPGSDDGLAPNLVIVRGRESGRIIPLHPTRMVLGRGEEAEVRLEETGVSRRHAEIRVEGQAVWLRDLDSRNGSFRNGQRVQRIRLADGDRIRLGDCELSFRFRDPEEGRLLESLYQRATHDALTGLLNRASLEDRLGYEIARGGRSGRGLAVAQLDLDDFKHINDRFGHAAGDVVLIEVARRLRTQLRQSDLAGRLGGEEFLLVLPDTPPAAAFGLAEKVRLHLAVCGVPWEDQIIPLSASLGVAIHRTGQGLRELLARVDEACYQAKHAGKNQVVLWEATP